MNLLENLQSYFDLKKGRIEKYFELEKAIASKKQEAQVLAKGYVSYKKDCEELIKGSVLDGRTISQNTSHIEERFNKYFVSYVNSLNEIRKSTEDLINKRDNYIKKHPEILEELQKAEESAKKSKPKKKMKKVMDEYASGSLKTSAGEKVTDRKQAIAIAYSEAGLNKAEIDNAVVTIVKGHEAGIIPDEEFQKAIEELKFFVELELEKGEEGKVVEKNGKKYVEMSLDELIEEHEKLTKVLESKDKEDDKEEYSKQKKELEGYIADKKKVKKSEEDVLEKAEEIKEIEESKTQKKYADAIVRDINDPSKILFLKRSKDCEFSPDTYGLAGGHIDEGEGPEAAVVRELQEETGLIALSFTKVGKMTKPEIHYYDVVVQETVEATESFNLPIVLEAEEHINYRFMTLEEAENEQLIPNLLENLKKIFDVNYKVKDL